MVAEDVILTIPKNIIVLIQTFGGILFLYLVFGIVNAIILYRRNKKLNRVIEGIAEMGRDVQGIRAFLVKKLK